MKLTDLEIETIASFIKDMYKYDMVENNLRYTEKANNLLRTKLNCGYAYFIHSSYTLNEILENESIFNQIIESGRFWICADDTPDDQYWDWFYATLEYINNLNGNIGDNIIKVINKNREIFNLPKHDSQLSRAAQLLDTYEDLEI